MSSMTTSRPDLRRQGLCLVFCMQFALLVACQQTNLPPATSTPSAEATPTFRSSETGTPTVTPTATPAPLPVDFSRARCAPDDIVIQGLDEEVDLPEGLIAVDRPYEDKSIVEVSAMDRHHELISARLGGDYDVVVGVSPNGKKLLFLQVLGDNLLELRTLDSEWRESVVSMDIELESVVRPGEDTSWGILHGRWIDDRWIVADLFDRFDSSGRAVRPVLIDTIDGVLMAYPDSSLPAIVPQSTFVMSPDLERVLYMSEEQGLVLVDTRSRSVLWNEAMYDVPHMILSGFGWGDPASWSPDSAFIAYVAHEEASGNRRPADEVGAAILDREGRRSRPITGFSEMDHIDGFGVSDLTWSPDGRFLAFVGAVTPAQSDDYIMSLYLYDRESDQVRCVTSLMGDTGDRMRMAWSPDSAFISYATILIDNIVDRRWFIVDLDNGSMFQVDEKVLRVVGWSPEFIP